MYKHIILSRFGGLGDMVMMSPLLKGIKLLYPDTKLTVVGEENAKQLMEAYPFVDEYLTFDKTKKSSWHLIKKLWRSDVVYLMDTLYHISIIYGLACIKKRVGLPHKRKFWLTDCLKVESWMNHAFEPVVYAHFLKEATGIDVTTLPNWDTFVYPDARDVDKQHVKELLAPLQGKDYIVASLETGGHAKNWPKEHWQTLFNELREMGKFVVLIGQSSQSYIDINLPDNVFDLRGKTNLLEVGEIIRNAELVINGCSFPVHVANAFNTPVIGLYGSEPSWRCAPQRIYKDVISPVDCKGCDVLYNSPGWCEKPFCMDRLLPSTVMEYVKKFYSEGKPLGAYKLVTGKS